MTFEEAGKKLDREIAKLKTYLDKEVKPETRQGMARMLRSASQRLSKLAKELDKPDR
jgi:hypothetical protein